MSKVVVDESQCKKLGKFLKKLPFPSAQEEAVRYKIPDNIMANLYFALVAICHQTTPHSGPALQGKVDGKFRKGWDYLREKLIRAVEAEPQIASVKGLAEMSEAKMENIFLDDDHKSTLSDISGRVLILREIGQTMKDWKIESIQELYERSGGWLLNRKSFFDGLIESLSMFSVYDADQVQKKMYFFLALMFNQGYWTYKDPENLGTPVDYHEVRGHLRYQTVKIIDSHLWKKILGKQEVSKEEDIDIRKAVFSAIMKVSKISKRTPNDLHYFFWNVFRNCCKRDEVHCGGCNKHSSLPERYATLSPNQCVFANGCGSANAPIKLSDHVIDTDLY